MIDTIVIGAGLGGLSAATRLAQRGQSVTLLTFGMGGVQLGQGTVDVLGYVNDRLIDRPFDGLDRLPRDHPYSKFELRTVTQALDWLSDLLPNIFRPGPIRNRLVPTALGVMRPTYLIQESMHWPNPATAAVVGPRQIKDFYPELMAANLEKTTNAKATGYHIDLPARPGEVDSNPVTYAKALDNPDFLAGFINAIDAVLGNEDAICVPAILGLTTNVHEQMVTALGCPVIEVLMPPPSIPGMRVNNEMTAIAQSLGVEIIMGSKVTGFSASGSHLECVTLHQAGRNQSYCADNFVYAGGGFESGSLAMDSYGKVSETLFNLPLVGCDDENLITGDYWADQKLFAVGVDVDESMRPISPEGVIFDNLYAVGGLLAGAQRWTEKSGDGIALVSAYRAVNSILGLVSSGKEAGDG
ncbi:MAG: glycerol-3-phosphate dehydrogenase subunit GlpB [Propionibacteriaceae bacterium]|nr:glycerol-3-phosphate dehydrogenase subunit GlpB [Propionibacteriaceae bacterium]